MIRNLFLFCLTIELLTGCRTSSALSLAAKLQIQEVHDKSEAQLTSLKYTLGPLDVLEITLYERPEFKREVTISRQGTFQYPLIGEVRARRLTVAQLEKMLTERLQHAHIPDPHVAVTVKTYHNHHIFLLGQVELPGVYALPARVELKELIIQAQGLTSEADDYLIVIHGERQSWFGQGGVRQPYARDAWDTRRFTAADEWGGSTRR